MARWVAFQVVGERCWRVKDTRHRVIVPSTTRKLARKIARKHNRSR